MKKTIALVLAAVLMAAVLMAGCSPAQDAGGSAAPADEPQASASVSTDAEESAPAEAKPEGEKIRVGYVMLNFTNTFYANLMETAQQAADDRGFEVTFKSCEGNLEQEIAHIENFIQEGVDVIIADPIDSEALVDVFTKGAEAGITMVSLFNEVKTPDSVTTYNAMLDHQGIFEGACMGLAAKMGGKGKVGFIAGTPGNAASEERKAGFQAMLDKYPDIELVAEEPSELDPTQGIAIFENWLTAYPDMDAVFVVFDDCVPAIVDMIEGNGKDILIAANDGLGDCVEMMGSDGPLVTDALINGYRAGYWTALYCYNLATGKTSETHEYMPTYSIIPTDVQELMKADGTYDDYDIITPEEALSYLDNVANEFKDY